LGSTPHILQPVDLERRGGDQQLAGPSIGDVVLLAELDRGLGPGLAQAGFEAAWCVVHPSMDNPAVVPGLVPTRPGLLLQHDHPGAGLELEQLQRRGQADDTATEHAVVVGHSPLSTSLEGGNRAPTYPGPSAASGPPG